MTKLEKLAQLFQVSIHVYRSLSFVATDSTKQFQNLNIVLKNKSGLFGLEFNGCEDKF